MAVTRDTNRNPEIARAIASMGGQTLRVGVFPESGRKQFAICAAHEYGTHISMTPRMRRFLGAKFAEQMSTPGGGSVTIPERSYVRSTFDSKHEEWRELFGRGVDALIDGGQTDAYELLRLLGASCVNDIRHTIQERFTMRSGNLLASVKYKVG